MTSEVPQTRRLSYHERYSLMRRNAGFAHPIVFLLTYPSKASLPPVEFLSKRIQELQDHFPLLHARIKDSQTKNPLYVEGARWGSGDILSERSYAPELAVEGGDAAELERLRKEKEKLLAEGIKLAAETDINSESMWTVTLLTASASETAYLVLSADHIIIDGRGLSTLLSLLLAPTLPADLPHETLSSIPIFDEVFDTRPRYAKLIPVALRELLLPKLPTLIQDYFKVEPCWPGTAFKKAPTSSPFALSLIHIPSDVVGPLKVNGRQNGVPTLHPIIKMAYLTAMWKVFHGEVDVLHLRGGTATSVRNFSAGHSYATACYSGSFDYDLPIKLSDPFWKMAKALSVYMQSDNAKKDALGGMGMLAFVPNGDGPFPASGIEGAGDEGRTPTNWERFFWDKALSKTPFGESMNISNLAYIPLKPLSHIPNTEAGPVDLIWGQMSTPFMTPLTLSVSGTETGISIASTWRDGSALERTDVERVEEVFKKVLGRLADGDGVTVEQLTV